MLRINIDALKGSEALKSGAMHKAIMDFVEKFKPEATYFTDHDGMRTGYFVFDMQNSQQMPEISEAFFDLGCKAAISPCMTPEDLRAGFAAVGI
jgi:hypothetical protein